nr:PREDICTED: protein HEATR9 isoform X1 [Anolis carolinensis]XP_016846851.1 PREDICTED: protein HEATR9 isoform X1 [Anolis carolinensis]|eukprot:XP_016846850.1 PREDICTED: protein HEATR9 isoform X1 [Anolis carolinensis]
MPKNSIHQTPHITYPRSPSLWRTYVPEPRFIQPRIVDQPDPETLKKQCMYRKKLEKEKKKAMKKRSDFSLSKFVKVAKIKQKEIGIWEEEMKGERLKGLIKYLASPVELEQIYAAQALGHLGVAEEMVISALYTTFQESNSRTLQYEAARSLALLGCLESSVMKVLIKHLKVVTLNRREDILAALKVSLQAWAFTPTFEQHCIGFHNSLTRNLQRLVDLQDPLDDISFDAALCLGYLDKSNLLAQQTMLMSLTQKDWKKKIQALVMLIKRMEIMNAEIIHCVLHHLQHCPVYKQRADSAQLLTTIGLEIIQQEGMEEMVFNVLLTKLSEEPFLVVRQFVALAIEELEMKKQVWEIVEKQLKDEQAQIRKQAVIALGVLGLRKASVFLAMLEMLELDTSMDVRVQVIRAFSTLGMNNAHVRKSLRRKEQTGGILARECTKALKVLDKISVARKESMIKSYRVA